jgi:hypothetical protein
VGVEWGGVVGVEWGGGGSSFAWVGWRGTGSGGGGVAQVVATGTRAQVRPN